MTALLEYVLTKDQPSETLHCQFSAQWKEWMAVHFAKQFAVVSQVNMVSNVLV